LGQTQAAAPVCPRDRVSTAAVRDTKPSPWSGGVPRQTISVSRCCRLPAWFCRGTQMGKASNRSRAFTLIELLIVVAIIAILALIAVPNFLEAQTRAKVSRVKADLRNIRVGLEAYRVDSNEYPGVFPPDLMGERWAQLSTPVAYLTGGFVDPFGRKETESYPGAFDSNNPEGHYDYWTYKAATGNYTAPPYDFPPHARFLWQVRSLGPDRWRDAGITYPSGPKMGFVIDYDPSNGTVSRGDIMEYGP